MYKVAALIALLALTGCGITPHCRTLSSAEFGAAVGSIAFPVGTIVGAGVGAVVGANTKPSDIYVGNSPFCW